MYPTQSDSIAIREAERLMEDTMARYDPSHDKYHVQRVRKTALHIARSISSSPSVPSRSPGPDLLVVELSALLHDVLDKKYVVIDVPEASKDPHTFFLPLFESIANSGGPDLIKDGRSRLIATIVDNISWSTEKKLLESGLLEEWHRTCLELHCVQDADRLDAIGAFGIMRCAAYSAISNKPLYTSVDDPAHTSSATQHFHDKLLHIVSRLKTPVGKQLATKRHQLMLDFLAALDEESLQHDETGN